MEQNQIDAKLFVGIEVSSEINMYLTDNIAWKQAEVEKPEGRLQRIHYRGKEYLGRYLSAKMIPTQIFNTQGAEIINQLTKYCPKVNSKKLKPVIFPQSFVS